MIRDPARQAHDRDPRPLAALLFLFGIAVSAPAPAESSAGVRSGEQVYEFYCYQCHGYDGRARTRAAASVDPPPRDFTAASPAVLTRERMIESVREGRPGTAMSSFGSVLAEREVRAVVDYVRERFMRTDPPPRRYHTAANGWPRHEQRYGAAFPFVTGRLPLDASPEALSPAQRQGLRLFFDGCVTCHDQPLAAAPSELEWDARPVSYPRDGYGHGSDYGYGYGYGHGDGHEDEHGAGYDDHADAHEGGQAGSGTDRHEADTSVEAAELAPRARAGARLFRDNCTFCHAHDGSGRNWIGTFIEPKAADLARPGVVAGRSDAELRALIRNGKPGTTMPAWRHVLSPEQIDRLLAYLRARFDPAAP